MTVVSRFSKNYPDTCQIACLSDLLMLIREIEIKRRCNCNNFKLFSVEYDFIVIVHFHYPSGKPVEVELDFHVLSFGNINEVEMVRNFICMHYERNIIM